MKQIKTEIEIYASVEKVWQTLMQFETYQNWNPFILSLSGDTEKGGRLSVRIQPPNSKPMQFNPRVLVSENQREFRWLGHLGIKGIFDGEHYFLLKEENGKTHFTHGENFSGILSGFVGNTLENTKKGFEAMNLALKETCEGN